MDVKTFTTFNQELLNDWQSFWDKSDAANYVNGPDWFLAVKETYSLDEYLIVAVYQDKNMIGVAALFKEKRYGLTVCSVPPADFVYGIPILVETQNQEVANLLMRTIIEHRSVVFDNVPEHLLATLQQSNMRFTYVPYSVNHIITFHYDEQGQVIVPHRKGLMRRARKVEDLFTFESYSGDRIDILEAAFALDERSSKKYKGYAAFSDGDTKELYRQLARHFRTSVRINLLSFDGQPMVYEIGFLIGKTYYGSQIAYDQEFKHLAPGKVLEVKLIEYLASVGVTRLNYGSGDNEVKQLLSSECGPLYKIIISDSTFVRVVLKNIYQTRDTIFQLLQKNKNVYKAYCRIKQLLSYD